MSQNSLRTLPDFTWEDWLKFKDPSENWGLADFAVRDVSFDCDVEGLITSFEYWFTNYACKPKSFFSTKLIGCDTQYFPEHFEIPLKLIWLTRAYFTVGYKYPLGLFWFPLEEENDRWVIHPGGGRQKVLKMFCSEDDRVEFLTFNTGGKRISFKELFVKKDKFDKWTKDILQADYMINWVAEKGTVIPHCLFESGQNNEHCKEPCERLIEILHKYNISVNGETVSSLGNTPMNITTDGSDESKLRAYMLLPFFELYNESILSKHQIQFIT
jgi:hypothetical protein